MSYRSAIRQGDALIWAARPNTLAAGESIPSSYVCRAGVFELDGTVRVEPFSVTDKGQVDGEEHFIVVVGRADTAALPPADYELAVQIHNDAVSPPYSDEEPVLVRVAQQRIPIDA